MTNICGIFREDPSFLTGAIQKNVPTLGSLTRGMSGRQGGGVEYRFHFVNNELISSGKVGELPAEIAAFNSSGKWLKGGTDQSAPYNDKSGLV